jgi:hypothetical protein
MAQTSHACPCSLAHHSGTYAGTLSEFLPQFAYTYAKTGSLLLSADQAQHHPREASPSGGGNPLHFRLNNQGASVADYFNATGTGAAPQTIL